MPESCLTAAYALENHFSKHTLNELDTIVKVGLETANKQNELRRHYYEEAINNLLKLARDGNL